ncbi:MAG: 3'-5' exonuclease [Pseudomonadota bacterium]
MSWLRRLLEGRGRGADEPGRWVVLDVESSGLDPRADRLLAIAAVAVHREGDRLRVALADSFEAVLRHDPATVAPADRANILVHGIGVGAMRAGAEPAEVLRAFASWAGDAPRLGFHVAFDRALIERFERSALGRASPARWIDLEPLAAIAHPEVRARALDEWMAQFGIECLQRHQAAADALATAELLLRLWPRLLRDCGGRVDALARLAAARRWVAP